MASIKAGSASVAKQWIRLVVSLPNKCHEEFANHWICKFHATNLQIQCHINFLLRGICKLMKTQSILRMIIWNVLCMILYQLWHLIDVQPSSESIQIFLNLKFSSNRYSVFQSISIWFLLQRIFSIYIHSCKKNCSGNVLFLLN